MPIFHLEGCFIKYSILNMLSLIVSSHKAHYFEQLSKNVSNTIGIDCPYEIVEIWNPGKIGLCQAYNEAAQRAKYPYLLFLHEDVEFVTLNWGKKLLTHLQCPKTGVIGLAGCSYVPNVPFAWWDNFEDTSRNIIQYDNERLLQSYLVSKKLLSAVLDGVFLGCRKKIWEKYKFSNKLQGFHGYDLDFTIRVANDYNNYIINDITLKHFSEGKADHNWWKEILRARELYNQPKRIGINKKKELRYYQLFEKRMAEFSLSNSKNLLLRYNNPRYIGYKAFCKNYLKLKFGL